MKPDQKLLLVEDNPTIAAAFERAGEQLNVLVEVATDGWDAIEKLRTDTYTRVVVDTDLPRHSGFGVLTYLREEVGDDLGNVLAISSGDHEMLRQRVSGRLQVIAKGAEIDVAQLVLLLKS